MKGISAESYSTDFIGQGRQAGIDFRDVESLLIPQSQNGHPCHHSNNIIGNGGLAGPDGLSLFQVGHIRRKRAHKLGAMTLFLC